MMRLPRFSYRRPQTAAEAVAILAASGPDALVVAGGTDVYPNMKQRLLRPKVVVALRGIPGLGQIEYDDRQGLRLGSMVTLREIAEHQDIRRLYPALASAAESVSTPQLRTMGTIGGNVCLDTRCNYYNQDLDWREALGFCLKSGGDICRVARSSPTCRAINCSDTAPVLQAFGASIVVTGPHGERRVRLEDFYVDDGIQRWNKAADEIVTGIAVPPPAPGTRSVYLKLRSRSSVDFPLLGVALVAELDGRGVCRGAKMVLGAVAPRPLEITALAEALVGSRLDKAAIERAARAVFLAGKPLDNTIATISYRKRMLAVYARRAIAQIAAAA